MKKVWKKSGIFAAVHDQMNSREPAAEHRVEVRAIADNGGLIRSVSGCLDLTVPVIMGLPICASCMAPTPGDGPSEPMAKRGGRPLCSRNGVTRGPQMPIMPFGDAARRGRERDPAAIELGELVVIRGEVAQGAP